MNIFVIRRFQGVCIQLPTLFSNTEGVLLFIGLWNAFYIPKIKNIDNNFFLNLKCPPVNCIFLMAFFTKMQHSNHALPVGSLLLGTWDNSLDGFRRCPYPTCLCLFKLVFVELAMVFVFFLNLSLSLSNSDHNHNEGGEGLRMQLTQHSFNLILLNWWEGGDPEIDSLFIQFFIMICMNLPSNNLLKLIKYPVVTLETSLICCLSSQKDLITEQRLPPSPFRAFFQSIKRKTISRNTQYKDNFQGWLSSGIFR